MKKVAVYVRVSTKKQTLENQLHALREVAVKEQWDLQPVFSDKVSGGKSKLSQRTGFKALCKAVEAREIQMVAVWSIDRLSRSLSDLLVFLELCSKNGVELYFHQQGLDTSKPAGRALFQMVGVFAEFEREIIRERIMAGLEVARENGVKFGPKVKYKDADRQAVLELHAQGKTCREIGRILGMGLGTVSRLMKAA